MRDKARLLLARRKAHTGIGYYLRQSAGRHILFSVLFWVVIALAWSAGSYTAAYIVGGFWAGRLMRDIQWYRALAFEWETSREFIDWPKVESLATEEPRIQS